MRGSLRALLRRLFAALLPVAFVLVAGCAALPEAPGGGVAMTREALATLDAFVIEGRFSLRHENKNYSGRLTWRHDGVANELLLASPFGQGIAQLTSDSGGARLTTSDGQTYVAANSELLTRQVLGYPLPLAQLTDWLRGRGAGVVENDAQGRPLHLRDADWRIDYDYDGTDAQELPSRLVAQQLGGVELRLRIDEWSSASAPAAGSPASENINQ